MQAPMSAARCGRQEECGRKLGEVGPPSTKLSKAKGHKPTPCMLKLSLHLPPCY